MRIDINCHGQTESFDLPSDADFVGVELKSRLSKLSISSALPNLLVGSSVECNRECKELSDGTLLTVFLYQFNEAARVLSLKEYPGLVYIDILYEDDLRIKVTV